MTAPSQPLKPRFLLLLLLISALIWFSNLEYRKLVRPDEGRYSEIPREMVASGDWLTPRLNGFKYFEKPPLQYWATAAAYTAFGEHHWTARLWPALTGLLGVLAVYLCGVRVFGADAGLYAALTLASSLLYAMIAHVNTLDMGLTFFMTAALAGFLLAQRPGASAADNRNAMLVAWAATAGAIMSKGLIGVVLPAAVVAIYMLVQRDFALLRRLHFGKGIGVLLLLTAPWFVAVSLANPEFPQFFFVHEHFERFLTSVHRRDQPWWYFVPILLGGVLPWTVTMADAFVRALRPQPGPAFQPQRFLLIWVAFIYLFFSVSSSKLPSYILPMFPALALLAGWRLAAISAHALKWQLRFALLAGGVWLAVTPLALEFANDEVPVELYYDYLPWLAAAALALVAGSGYALWQNRRGRIRPALIALSLSGLLAAQLALTGHDALSPASSSYYLAQRIAPYLKPGVPFYSVGTYEQTLPFYIKRTVTQVEFLDELSFGAQLEPRLWVPDLATFEKLWRGQTYALALTDPDTYERLLRMKLPMRVIARDTRRIVVRTP
ncbi:MAG TPA: glycosyltransferase family 39 protein [Burkholderiales bacterium]|nr:glycosyltransferase family 39 protein [Burkholderiales bacterium]